MSEQPSTNIEELELLGGNLCLDFANSVDHDRAGGTRHEFLTDVHGLIAWAKHAQAIDEQSHSILLDIAIEDPHEADMVFERALEIREAVQRVFSAIAGGNEPEPDSLALLQRHYLIALESGRLRQSAGEFDWEFDTLTAGIKIILATILIAAIDLIRSGALHRLRRCPGDDGQCGWLFLDTTKNGSRKWCSMQTCGSRDKMRRFYRRHRS